MSVSQARRAKPAAPAAWLKGANLALTLIAFLVAALVVAVKTWGLVALTMAALPLVPVMFVIFIWISLP